MTLRERMDNDLKSAMKSGDSLRVSVLRMVRSEIQYSEIDQGKRLTDEDIEQIVSKERKKRREAIDQFAKAGRTDLVEKETAEEQILTQYQPQQLDESEIIGIVREVITEVHATSKADKGKVMSGVMPNVRGKADGKLVGRIVDELLAGNSA